jgi:putative phosphoesterase
MVQKGLRVAAIYDVHGNLPALEAVLAELESIKPDLIVVGGDVVAGPMPAEVLDRLVTLGERICFVRGNADREVVAAYDDRPHADPIDVADPAERVAAYAASKIDREHRDLLASFVERLIVEVEGVGQVLFCHGSPRSDEEIVTAATTELRLREILARVDQGLVVCGHTHAQFDRRVGAKRVINAGSVGMPYQGSRLEPSGYCSGSAASLFGAATMIWIGQSGRSEPQGTRTPRTWRRSFSNRRIRAGSRLLRAASRWRLTRTPEYAIREIF